MHASYLTIGLLKNSVLASKSCDSHITLLYQEIQKILWNHYILYLRNNQRLTRYINMSITPPKSLMTAVGVKNKPSAIIFRLSSMLMNITNTYSAIWNRQKAVWSQQKKIAGQCLSSELWAEIQQRYLQSRCMHDSSKGGFEHHWNAGADGYDDHDPVQVSHQSQQITAKDQTELRNASAARSQRKRFCDFVNVTCIFLWILSCLFHGTI